MFEWISENAGSILVLIVLVFIIFMIIRKMIKNKKRGKTLCGCACEHCAMSKSCHKKQSNL